MTRETHHKDGDPTNNAIDNLDVIRGVDFLDRDNFRVTDDLVRKSDYDALKAKAAEIADDNAMLRMQLATAQEELAEATHFASYKAHAETILRYAHLRTTAEDCKCFAAGISSYIYDTLKAALAETSTRENPYAALVVAAQRVEREITEADDPHHRRRMLSGEALHELRTALAKVTR